MIPRYRLGMCWVVYFVLPLIAGCQPSGSQSPATTTNPSASSPRLLDSSVTSFKMDGIISLQAPSFACSIGNFAIQRSGAASALSLNGSGLLINSSWLHAVVETTSQTTYSATESILPSAASSVSVFCIGGDSVSGGPFPVKYAVAQKGSSTVHAVAASASTSPEPTPRLLDSATKSWRLDGIVDGNASTFACMFGQFKANVVNTESQQTTLTFSGNGVLVNSGWLHVGVNANPSITYSVSGKAAPSNGSDVAVFCNNSDSGAGFAPLDFWL